MPCPVKCKWSLWSSWGDCFCNGTRHANRKIEIPAANGGKNCDGSSSRSKLCTLTGTQTEKCIQELLSQHEFERTKLFLASKENRIEEAKKMMEEANNLNIVSELV